MVELLYEDEELQAVWSSGKSSYVIITFGDMLESANGVDFSARRPVQNNEITCIGIMPKRPNWYPRKNLVNLFAAIQDRLEPYAERIMYGSSMGGHGAIKSSKLAQASLTIALCPQWSINPGDCEEVSLGWQGAFDPEIMGDMKIERADLTGRLFIFSDPVNQIDENHRKKIAALTDQGTYVPVFFSDHHIAPVLSGSTKFRRIIDLCRAGSAFDLLKLVNAFRRPHFARIRCVVERGLVRKPVLTLKVVLKALTEQGEMRHVARDVAPLLHKVAISKSTAAEWKAYVRYRIDAAPSIGEKLSLISLLPKPSGPLLSVQTSFGTKVFADVFNRKLGHGAVIDKGCVPVIIRSQGEAFYADTGCKVDIEIDSKVQSVAQLTVAELPDGRLTLGFGGTFLSADPSGELKCDRTVVNEWEKFQARGMYDHQ